MSPTTRAWLQIHFCVVLWGFTAILGRMISLAAVPLVWWRVVLVTAALCLVPRFWRGLARIPWRLRLVFAGIGVIVALHWLCFYGSIKLSNASVAATCIAFAPLIVSFVEPLATGQRFNPRDLILGLAVIPGVALVVGGTPVAMRAGIVAGVASALLAAVFTSLNKKYVEHADALGITGIEMGAGVVVLAAVSPWLSPADTAFALPGARDGLLLLILALGCTLLPFALSLVAQRHLSAFATTLAINLEPVYAILLAIVLLDEQRELTAGFYAGVAIILSTVFLHPLLARRPVWFGWN